MSGCTFYFNVNQFNYFGNGAGGYPATAGGIGGKTEYAPDKQLPVLQDGKKKCVGGTVAANPLNCCAGYHL